MLGDPLQGIFDFAEPTVRWTRDVLPAFPHLLELSTPWRWHGKNEALGRWLLEVRQRLIAGQQIDLQHAALTWERVSPETQRTQAYRLHQMEGTVLALRGWKTASHEFGRSMGGVFRSMEEMECNSLLELAQELPRRTGPARAALVLRFAADSADCMTGVRDAIPTIWNAIEAGHYPTVDRLRVARPLAEALIAIADSDDVRRLASVARHIEQLPGVRIFRLELWREYQRTLAEAQDAGYASLAQKAWAIRSRHRVMGRQIDRRTVSRVLLIKGLECDHACILDLDEYENARRLGEGAKNAYVALTRGAQSLTVLSANPTVRFSAPSL